MWPHTGVGPKGHAATHDSRFGPFWFIERPMSPVTSPLANRRFLKMNGLGNEITVLDLRGTGVLRRTT